MVPRDKPYSSSCCPATFTKVIDGGLHKLAVEGEICVVSTLLVGLFTLKELVLHAHFGLAFLHREVTHEVDDTWGSVGDGAPS